MDLGNAGWVNGKDLWDNIGRLQRFFQEGMAKPARWAPEVALIVDETSPFYTRCTRDLHSPLVYQMRSQFSRIGTSFGIYLLSDLVEGKVPPAKILFFANCYRLDSAQREAVRRATRGKAAVWFYGGGFLRDDASDAHMAAAIGLKVARGKAQPGQVTPEPGGLAEGIAEPFGTATVLDPLWGVSEEGVEVIGRYADGTVAAAAKQTPEGLRATIGALHCPAKLLRNLAKRAGVHLYADSDDVVLTDGEFLCLAATSAGRKSIHFPKAHAAITALDGRELAPRASTVTLDMDKGETLLLLLR